MHQWKKLTRKPRAFRCKAWPWHTEPLQTLQLQKSHHRQKCWGFYQGVNHPLGFHAMLGFLERFLGEKVFWSAAERISWNLGRKSKVQSQWTFGYPKMDDFRICSNAQCQLNWYNGKLDPSSFIVTISTDGIQVSFFGKKSGSRFFVQLCVGKKHQRGSTGTNKHW